MTIRHVVGSGEDGKKAETNVRGGREARGPTKQPYRPGGRGETEGGGSSRGPRGGRGAALEVVPLKVARAAGVAVVQAVLDAAPEIARFRAVLGVVRDAALEVVPLKVARGTGVEAVPVVLDEVREIALLRAARAVVRGAALEVVPLKVARETGVEAVPVVLDEVRRVELEAEQEVRAGVPRHLRESGLEARQASGCVVFRQESPSAGLLADPGRADERHRDCSRRGIRGRRDFRTLLSPLVLVAAAAQR